MVRNSNIPPESFNELLAWLDPDREVAAKKYLELRKDLEKIFTWRGGLDPEGLTDDTIERVARNIHELRRDYEGDPLRYFHGVAKYVMLEHRRFTQTQTTLDDSVAETALGIKDEIIELRQDCLESCLNALKPEQRKLILSYYEETKGAKIKHRAELAKELGLSTEALRVRTSRIRVSLHQCIKQCLRKKLQGK
jgi:DNA-directed RNA polymerase specialized sigma24 family protein